MLIDTTYFDDVFLISFYFSVTRTEILVFLFRIMSSAEQLVSEPNTISSSCYVAASAMHGRQQRSGPLYDVTKVVRDFWPSQMRKIEHMTEVDANSSTDNVEFR
ncbi:hypothetical protein DICVIV_12437 [Dictyocaulus viviparus]|uniref:Uncharacterized protein n=1 Tax=Dictyocaulus viviparus TaxID=29172 RepID=A0A0D8XAH8_DICVI|nr:hypothetical protein DICVIV_12437 [Dictyocaulus viviparus]